MEHIRISSAEFIDFKEISKKYEVKSRSTISYWQKKRGFPRSINIAEHLRRKIIVWHAAAVVHWFEVNGDNYVLTRQRLRNKRPLRKKRPLVKNHIA